VPWPLEFHPAVEAWIRDLSESDQETLLAAFAYLESVGPTAGRPLVDTIQNSRHSNMKELRPASAGQSEFRLLFAFDATRTAIFLVAGDKLNNWRTWYDTNIPIADDRFDERQVTLRSKQPPEKKKSQQRRGKRQ
jgi:hypothetical protein